VLNRKNRPTTFGGGASLNHTWEGFRGSEVVGRKNRSGTSRIAHPLSQAWEVEDAKPERPVQHLSEWHIHSATPGRMAPRGQGGGRPEKSVQHIQKLLWRSRVLSRKNRPSTFRETGFSRLTPH